MQFHTVVALVGEDVFFLERETGGEGEMYVNREFIFSIKGELGAYWRKKARTFKSVLEIEEERFCRDAWFKHVGEFECFRRNSTLLKSLFLKICCMYLYILPSARKDWVGETRSGERKQRI